MRVFNLTDVSTPVLEQRQLVNQHIAVGGRMIAPGEFADVGETPENKAACSYLLQVGAVALERVPPTYASARSTSSSAMPVPVRHVDLQETKVVSEPPAGPPPEGETVALKKDNPVAPVEPEHKPKRR